MSQTDQIEVLWVDDDIANLGEFVSALREIGFVVTTASSTNEALGLARTNPYDVILVDIRMRAPDGIELLRRLHPIQPHASLAVLSSFLYLPKYRGQLQRLDFPVELIDKDMPVVDAPDFAPRFLEPIVRLSKLGVQRTIDKEAVASGVESDIDPFSIEWSEFMAKPILEKDRLTQRARIMIEPILNRLFREGYVWALFCGSRREPRAKARTIDDVPPDETILDFARAQKRAPYQFYAPVDVDDMHWPSCGGTAHLSNYPTVTLVIAKIPYDLHFDTGAQWTFFSYEELVGLGMIRPTTLFASGSRGGREYSSVLLNMEATLVSQGDGQTKIVRIKGQAVRNWEEGPFIRMCNDTCGKGGKRGSRVCPYRKALIGRNLLTDNGIALILDGHALLTRLENGGSEEGLSSAEE